MHLRCFGIWIVSTVVRQAPCRSSATTCKPRIQSLKEGKNPQKASHAGTGLAAVAEVNPALLIVMQGLYSRGIFLFSIRKDSVMWRFRWPGRAGLCLYGAKIRLNGPESMQKGSS